MISYYITIFVLLILYLLHCLFIFYSIQIFKQILKELNCNQIIKQLFYLISFFILLIKILYQIVIILILFLNYVTHY